MVHATLFKLTGYILLMCVLDRPAGWGPEN